MMETNLREGTLGEDTIRKIPVSDPVQASHDRPMDRWEALTSKDKSYHRHHHQR